VKGVADDVAADARCRMEIAWYLRRMGARWRQIVWFTGYLDERSLRTSWACYVKRHGPPPWPPLEL